MTDAEAMTWARDVLARERADTLRHYGLARHEFDALVQLARSAVAREDARITALASAVADETADAVQGFEGGA